MSAPRFFIPKEAIKSEPLCIRYEDESLAKQLKKVLRLRKGDYLDFLDGTGNLYHCSLSALEGRSVEASILSVHKGADRSRKTIVALSPLKSGRFEWAIEKLTELNVAEIVPTILERSVVRIDGGTADSGTESATNKMTRWRSIAREAAEQCERLTLPHLVAPLSFEKFLDREKQLRPNGLRLICAERRDAPSIAESLCNLTNNGQDDRSLTIAVGAEGGFSEDEIHQAELAGFKSVSLGKLILRAETAAIYALAIVASTSDHEK
jgi:16S rRNA (uracil1498-N3)-methyltransferase